MQQIPVIVAPNTHWDREWLMTQGQYQVRLVRMMDHLLDIIAQYPQYRFTLDGQMVMLEDYFEIKPEQFQRVHQAVQKGQLAVGPWYVLADQFLQSGESAIRNLLEGKRLAEQWDMPRMMVGYNPDCFGSIATMPMLLCGFDIHAMLYGRGRPAMDKAMPHMEMRWQSPDNSVVVASSYGYANGLFLSYPDIWRDIFHDPAIDMQSVLEKFLQQADAMRDKAAAGILYFSVGVDHMEPKRSLPDVMDALNGMQSRYALRFGSAEDYLQAVGQSGKPMVCYEGELRGSEAMPMDLVGTLSSHMPLKIWNDRCETLLIHVVEPLSAMAQMLCGYEYPTGMMQKLWRLLLLNQPHDSICGCSLDEVHREMASRYEQIATTGEYLEKEAVHALTEGMDTRLADDPDAVAVVVFNPTDCPSHTPLQARVRIPKRLDVASCYLADEKGDAVACDIQPVAYKCKDLESVFMTNRLLGQVLSKDAPDEHPDDEVFTVADIGFVPDAVPPFGWRTWWLKKGKEIPMASDIDQDATSMENTFLHVEFLTDGSLRLRDKRTDHVYPSCNFLIAREDIGNGYDHKASPNGWEADSRKAGVRWQALERLPHCARFQGKLAWDLPACSDAQGPSDQRNAMKVTFTVTLYAQVPFVSVCAQVDNTCRDHYTRIAFDTGLDASVTHAYDHYNCIERPIASNDVIGADTPFQGFVDVSDGQCGLALLAKGIQAYQAQKGEGGVRLYLPLVRAVGLVGGNHPAEEAQCQGKLSAEYAIMPHAGDWREGKCLSLSRAFHHPLIADGQIQQKGELPAQGALFKLDGMPLYTSALKRAQDGRGIILRLWNPGPRQHMALVSPYVRQLQYTELDESDDAQADPHNIDVAALELVTLRLQ